MLNVLEGRFAQKRSLNWPKTRPGGGFDNEFFNSIGQ